MAISDNLRGVIYMCVSMLAFTVNDTFMKSVTSEVPLFQVIFLRGILASLGLAAVGMATRVFRQKLGKADLRLIGIRGLADVFATICFLVALLHMPLANLSAIMQALPLVLTLVAALVFGDRIGWRRLLAILFGFVGVMVIIRPGTDAFSLWSVLGVLSVLCVVVRDLSVRKLGAHVPSVVIALGAAILVALMGLGLSLLPSRALGLDLQHLSGWQALTFGQGAYITAAASFVIVGYLCAVTAMRWGDMGVVAPFRYTSLLWAVVLGFVAFGDLPDGWTLIGAAVVVASGIYTLLRERQLRRTAAATG